MDESLDWTAAAADGEGDGVRWIRVPVVAEEEVAAVAERNSVETLCRAMDSIRRGSTWVWFHSREVGAEAREEESVVVLAEWTRTSSDGRNFV